MKVRLFGIFNLAGNKPGIGIILCMVSPNDQGVPGFQSLFQGLGFAAEGFALGKLGGACGILRKRRAARESLGKAGAAWGSLGEALGSWCSINGPCTASPTLGMVHGVVLGMFLAKALFILRLPTFHCAISVLIAFLLKFPRLMSGKKGCLLTMIDNNNFNDNVNDNDNNNNNNNNNNNSSNNTDKANDNDHDNDTDNNNNNFCMMIC